MCTTDTYDVIGMTCDHCARAVTAEVSALEGVSDVEVDLTNGQVLVTADRALATEDLRQAVEEAGYTLA
jgi:copper ion binding protein